MSNQLTRRQMLRNTALTGVGVWTGIGSSAWARSKSPNEKLNIAGIGCGGRGAADLNGCASENIVALCDVDESRAGGSFNKWPKAKRYSDFRKMLDEMHGQIDAVIVATPDHTHAPAAVRAMKMGKHCYCEKPLTWSAYEARVMSRTAAEQKVATQMGNQGTATGGLRRGVEVLQAGAIGKVREIHIWTNRPGPYWAQGIERPKDRPSVPSGLNWDLWLGPAPPRPYHPIYAPTSWRGWVDFGTGALGDMACHTLNLAYWAMELKNPISVEAESSGLTYSGEGEQKHAESFPKWNIIRYQFPARGDLPPLVMTWYDGGKKGPVELLEGEKLHGSGLLLIGDEGKLYSVGDNGDSWTLLPKEKFRDYKGPEETIPRSVGHHKEWLIACKGGPAAMSNFGYAGPLAETVVLGNLAVLAGKKIEWDAENLRAKSCPEVEEYIRRDYRKGWEV